MRPFRGSLWCCALAALAMANGSAKAAWNNVFQVCCHNCQSSNYVAAPAPAPMAAAPAPCGGCQQCTTQYLQRCYYQPVTTYRQSCYMEPVTTYRTSYYYEPCTSYRYSCYYDPCSCRYQQVAQPVTTYRLRSRCCPVTSYLQRCCMQPVTSYQQVTYYVPQTTCTTTTIGAPVASPCPSAAHVSVPPAMPGAAVQGAPLGSQPAVSGGPIGSPPAGASGQPYAVPGASGQPYSPPAGASGGPEPPLQAQAGQTSNRSPYLPKPNGATYRQPQLQAPVPVQPAAPAPKANVRFDRITSAPRHNTEGQVVRANLMPLARTKVIFVRVDEQGGRRSLTTDDSGRFQTTLAAGSWVVYTQDASGRLVYQQKVRVAADAPAPLITLVSR